MPSQEKIIAPVVFDGNDFYIPGQHLTREQALEFNATLHDLLICNVANDSISPKIPTLFDSCANPLVQTIDIDQAVMDDLQALTGIKDSFVKIVLNLIEFYKEHSNLNLIFHSDALFPFQSVIKYPNQLAQQLRQRQQHFPTVKIVFDSLTTRLGIFCRHARTALPSRAFMSQLADRLKQDKIIAVNNTDLPRGYQANRAMLRQHLKPHFPNQEIKSIYQNGRVIISLRSQISS
jgi:hypothetical protein